jgi:malic enzyme
VRDITPEMLIHAATALAGHVANPDTKHILPDPLDKTVAQTIAAHIV